MGTVWVASDELLNRDVAVKEVSPPADVSPAERAVLRERALREARMAARLNHPNVVTIYDVVEDGDGWPWIVMELLKARSLRDMVVEDGPLSPRQAASVALELTAALRAAHALGILHRDVKPGNVLIDADGHAVLADFGVARADDNPTLTASGMILGSPSYMAPERARGEPGGPESDVWSLGATLYATVEGRPPFDRTGALATLMAAASSEPDPPSRCGDLWPVISRLLRRDPGERPSLDATERMLREIAGPGELARTIPVAPGDGNRGPTVSANGGPAADSFRLAERTRAFRAALGRHVDGLPEVMPGPATDGEDGSRPEGSRPEWGAVVAAAKPSGSPPDRAGPARQPSAPTPGVRGRGSTTRYIIWAMAAAVLAALAVVLFVVSSPAAGPRGRHSAAGRGHASQPTAGSQSSQPSGPSGPGSSASGPAASAPGSPPNATPSGGSRPRVGILATVPAGFWRYRDATGFSIAVPVGWTVSHQDGLVYVLPPSGSAFLLIQQSDRPKPNPLADWRQQEASRRGTYPAYHRIRLAAIDYPQAEKAADWEFTYDRNGVLTHVLNRNVLANPAHAYALYWSTPADQWTQSWHYFQVFARTFQPAGR
jgi:hypothetical protein